MSKYKRGDIIEILIPEQYELLRGVVKGVSKKYNRLCVQWDWNKNMKAYSRSYIYLKEGYL